MPKRQGKRRRRRYQPESAYAGDVRPTGVLSIVSDPRMIRFIFIAMALALAAGGLTAVFGRNALRGNSNPAGFVAPGDNSSGTPAADGPEIAQYDGPPPMSIDPANRYVATITTDLGDIQVELFPDKAPDTVNNFVFLARDGFYDGLVFHHVVGNFTATAGDPACTADSEICRGDGGPGYTIPDEVNDTPFEAGVLGMATRPDVPGSAGSQFFIALTDSEQFDGFTAFGRIVSGLDVAEQVTAGTEIQTVQIEEQ